MAEFAQMPQMPPGTGLPWGTEQRLPRAEHLQQLDGVSFRLAAPFDFGFIHNYGTVFKVFDDQDSGNICFGVRAASGRRYFVKFAGASPIQYLGAPDDAIASLRQAVAVYQDLAHPSLINLVRAEDVGGGFALVFDWVDAICAHRQYPDDHRRFKTLPLAVHDQVFRDVLAFHEHVAERGYVAIDFYDGSIMWDQTHHRTVICDIDFYQRSPYVGRMGLWGSTRFITPEEQTDGAVIDEVTNVYTMGATAFCLFADSDRSREAWPLGDALYEVAARAVSDDRAGRQQSVAQLAREWAISSATKSGDKRLQAIRDASGSMAGVWPTDWYANYKRAEWA